jgi:hypothetical protein
MKSYEWVKPVSPDSKVIKEVKLTGEINLHSTKQELAKDGWIETEDSHYLLPSGYIYQYVNNNFLIVNKKINDEKEHYYW